MLANIPQLQNEAYFLNFLRQQATVEWGGYRWHDGSYTHLLQIPEEFLDLLKFLHPYRDTLKSLLEIGYAEGFSNSILHRALSFEQITGIDLEPSFVAPRFYSANIKHKPLTLIFGNTRDPNTSSRSKALGPYDVVFIDGSHLFEDVILDFKEYVDASTKVVVFHDIKNPLWPGCGNAWNEINSTDKSWHTLEFICDRYPVKCGIGVMSRLP